MGVSFSFSRQFLLIQGTFFHFWQRSLGTLCPNLLYVVETALLGLDKVCTSCLDVYTSTPENYSLSLHDSLPICRDPRAPHAQIFCMWCKHLDLAWTRYGHYIWVSLS